jgi:hypothetical protein
MELVRPPKAAGADNCGLFKITGGPQNGTHYYTAKKQKFTTSGIADESNDEFYVYFPNNTGELPDGETEINGEYHLAIFGWSVTEQVEVPPEDPEGEPTTVDVVKPVLVSAELLGQSDFVPPPPPEAPA